jgi:hypothetical protein
MLWLARGLRESRLTPHFHRAVRHFLALGVQEPITPCQPYGSCNARPSDFEYIRTPKFEDKFFISSQFNFTTISRAFLYCQPPDQSSYNYFTSDQKPRNKTNNVDFRSTQADLLGPRGHGWLCSQLHYQGPRRRPLSLSP